MFGLWDTALKWGGILAALLGAIWGIYFRGRSAGKKAEKEKLAKATRQTEEKWNEIDRNDTDFDTAIDGLQARSRDRR